MKLDPCRLSLLLVLGLSSAGSGAEHEFGPEQLQKPLERYPDADAKYDGTFSMDEAFAYWQKLAGSCKGKAHGNKSSLPKPTHPNVSYGPDARNVLDLCFAKSGKPTLLLVFIHGGGFVGGDTSQARPETIRRWLDADVSFKTIS